MHANPNQPRSANEVCSNDPQLRAISVQNLMRYHIHCSLWLQLTVSVDNCRVGMGGEKTLGVLPPEVNSMH